MTEASYQEGRKVMQRANFLRGKITTCKGEVAKWTKIEDVHRKEYRDGQANGAKKMLDKAIEKLNHWRKLFSELKFPNSNMVATKISTGQCESCGDQIPSNESFCKTCTG